MPAVSVIVTTYNRAAMVGEAVASVNRQTFRDFELIVVDDGSEDGTGELFSGRCDVGYIRQEHAGVAAARNVGVAAATGEFIAFLDSDDLWRPAKLEKQIAFFRWYPEFAIMQTEEIWVRKGRRVNPRKYHQKPHGWVLKPSLNRCLISPSAVMMKRALFVEVGGFDESFPACEDYDLWLRVALTHQVGLLNEPLVVKRGGHPDQLSRQFWGMDRFRVASLCKLLNSGSLAPQEMAEVRRVLEAKARVLSQGAARRGRIEEAARYLTLASWPLPRNLS